MSTPAGCFVVIEGPEGAGKSTLIRSLGARLQAAGKVHSLWREPGGTPVAEAADPDALANPEVLALFAPQAPPA